MYIAHFSHWYHLLIYLSPLALVALAIWWVGRGLNEELDDDQLDDDC